MQFVLIIYHGTFPLPGTPESELLSEEERKAIYADYATLNEMENMTPGPPLGLPENATTVRVENGSTVTTEGPYLGVGVRLADFMWSRPRTSLPRSQLHPAYRRRDWVVRSRCGPPPRTGDPGLHRLAHTEDGSIRHADTFSDPPCSARRNEQDALNASVDSDQ
jgi:hypothetical protein